jgi:hypothetical protein
MMAVVAILSVDLYQQRLCPIRENYCEALRIAVSYYS